MADIDFANSDSRMKFLQEHLGHLMGGIDKNYGQVLMDELMLRLEKTVSIFNDEVKVMLGQLQEKEAEEETNFASKPILGQQSSAGADTENSALSEFERRLEALDK